VLVEERPSNLGDLHKAWPITEPDTFYTFASRALGWTLPASVGVALAERLPDLSCESEGTRSAVSTDMPNEVRTAIANIRATCTTGFVVTKGEIPQS
jgi:hypothetical protein